MAVNRHNSQQRGNVLLCLDHITMFASCWFLLSMTNLSQILFSPAFEQLQVRAWLCAIYQTPELEQTAESTELASCIIAYGMLAIDSVFITIFLRWGDRLLVGFVFCCCCQTLTTLVAVVHSA